MPLVIIAAIASMLFLIIIMTSAILINEHGKRRKISYVIFCFEIIVLFAILIWMIGAGVGIYKVEYTDLIGYYKTQNITLDNGSQISIIEYEGWDKQRVNISAIKSELLPEETIIVVTDVEKLCCWIQMGPKRRKYKAMRLSSPEYEEMLKLYNQQSFVKNEKKSNK